MRPKKRILLYCADDTKASVQKFILENRGASPFQVIPSCSEDVTWGLLNSWTIDAALIMRTSILDESFAADLALHQSNIKTVFWNECGEHVMPESIHAMKFYPRGTSTADILQGLRIAAAGKRGPKRKVA